MLNGLFHLLVIAAAVWGIISGYRCGFMRQMGLLVAVAFGIVAARLAGPDCMGYVDDWMPESVDGFKRNFVVATLSYGGIYLMVMGIISLISIPLGKLMAVFESGVLDSIAGAIFRLFQFLMVLSIVYNIIVDLNPSGELTKSSRQHDGNVVEGVIKVAPAILGFPDGEEVGYRQQLEDARKIS